MAGFNLTANINARLVNVKKASAQLRQAFSGRTVDIKINLDSSTRTNIAKTKSSLDALYKSLQNVNREAKNAAASVGQLSNALASAAGGMKNINNVTSQVTSNMNKQSKATRGARTEMQEFGRVSGLALRRFAGFSVATAVVFGFGRAVVNATSEAIAFERELIKVAQVTGRSVASLAPLTRQIKLLSTSLGVASADLVKVSRILSQAGLSISQTRIALEALAKTDLAPTFKNMEQTADGAIAIMRQFGISASELEGALGSINAVAGQFAVSSDDIIAAVKRAGGVFAATSKGVVSGTEALHQFIAIFTSVRATTREGAETIATGLRTIFTRIQRPSTIKYLKQLGINLQDAQGKFVGGYEAANLLAKALKNLDPRDSRFAQIIEELGGFRQVGKVIPIITAYETRLKALAVAQAGAASLTKDAALAQETLQVRLTKVKEEFTALIREITQTTTFRVMASTILNLASALIRLADAIKPIIPLLGALGTVALFRGGTKFISGFSRGVRGQNFHKGGLVRQEFSGGGDIRPRGLVPGGKGIKDDVRATLQSGEFVVRRKAVDAIGVGTLKRLNRADGGRVELRKGGILGPKRLIDSRSVGAAVLKPEGDFRKAHINIKPKEILGGSVKTPPFNRSKSFAFTREALGVEDSQSISQIFTPLLVEAIDKGAMAIQGSGGSAGSTQKILQSSGVDSIFGNLFEAVLTNVESKGLFDKSLDPNRPFDFTSGFKSPQLKKRFQLLGDVDFIDAKASKQGAEPRKIKDKVIQQLEFEAVDSMSEAKLKKTRGLAAQSAKGKGGTQAALIRQAQKIAGLGGRLGRAEGGDVPALLTRGEFVFNKRAAKRLGGGVLHGINNYDRTGKSEGGEAEARQPFILGGLATIGGLIVRKIAVPFIKSTRQMNKEALKRMPTFSRWGGNAGRAVRGRGAAKAGAATASRSGPGAGATAAASGSKAAKAAAPGGGGWGNTLFGGGMVADMLSRFFPGSSAGAGALGATVGTAAAQGMGVKGPKGLAIGAGVGIFSWLTSSSAKKADQAAAELDASLASLGTSLENLKSGGTIETFREESEGVFDALNTGVKKRSLWDNVKSAFSGSKETTAKLAGGIALDAGLGAAMGGGFPGAIVGAASGAAVGAGMIWYDGPEASVSKEHVIADSRRRESDEINRGAEFAAQTAQIAEAALHQVQEGVKAGLSQEEIYEGLSSEERIAMGMNKGTATQKGAIAAAEGGGYKTDAEGNRLGGPRTRKQNQEVLAQAPAKAEIAAQIEVEKQNKKVAEAYLLSAKNVDLFTQRLLDFNAAVKRSANAGIGADKKREARLSRISGGAGIFSGQDRRNVWDNTRGFSTEEIKKEASGINQSFGGPLSQSRGRVEELTSAAVGAKVLQEKLPDILNKFQKEQTLDSKNALPLKDFLENELGAGGRKGALSNVGAPDVFIDSVIKQLTDKYAGQGQNPDDVAQSLRGMDAAAFAEEMGKPINAALKGWVDAMNANLADYEKSMGEWLKLQNRANKAQDDVVQQGISNENRIKNFAGGPGLTAADRSRSSRAAITQSGRRAGITGGINRPANPTGQVTVGTVVDRLSVLDDTQAILQSAVAGTATPAQLKELQTQGINTDDPAALAQAQTEVSSQQQAAVKTLQLIHKDTSQISASEKRLVDLAKVNDESLSTFEKLATASPQERADLERNAALANQALGGAQLEGADLKNALSGFDFTAAERKRRMVMAGATEEEADHRLKRERESILRNDPEFNALRPGFGIDPERQKQQQASRDANATSEQAGTALASRYQKDSDEFKQDTDDAYYSRDAALKNPEAVVKTALTTSLDNLNTTVAGLSIPSTITIGGMSSIDINISGLKDVADLKGGLKDFVVAQIESSIEKLRQDLTGEAKAP